MKIIKYYSPGAIPSKKNSRVTNRKTGRSFPSKRYRDWHKECSEFIKEEFGLPPEPIQKCHKIVLDIYFGDKRAADNTNKAESVHDLIVDLGIIEDDKWQITGQTVQNPHYEKGMPGFIITIWVDDKNPYHKDMNWDSFNVVDENSVSIDNRMFYRNHKDIVKRRKYGKLGK